MKQSEMDAKISPVKFTMFPHTVNQNVYFSSFYKVPSNDTLTKRVRSPIAFPKSYPSFPAKSNGRLNSSLKKVNQNLPFHGALSSSNGRINSNYRKINNLSKPKFSSKYVKVSQTVSPKTNKYRWENNDKSIKQNLAKQSTDGTVNASRTLNDKYHLSATCTSTQRTTNNHYGSEIPFFSVISKRWFSDPPCDVRCVKRTFNLQSCCFISERYLPTNTLSLNQLSGVSNRKAEIILQNQNSFVKLSDHKLIRKPLKTEMDPSVVFCTRRKLIRECKSNADHRNVPLAVARKDTPFSVAQKENLEMKLNSTIKRSSFASKRKRSTPLVVLTKRKLVRMREEKNETHHFGVTLAAKTKNLTVSNLFGDWRKRPCLKLPSRLIRVNHNKLIRSTLLRKHSKQPKTNLSSPTNSVLSRMIQYRRLPCSRSSYVLLTRNKLIKKSKFKNRTWKKYADSAKEAAKKCRSYPKTFVSLGSNKLIRKSLFKKTNKVGSQKNVAPIASPVRNKFLIRMLNSPRRRVQTFTNHLSRVNLKYVSNLPAFSLRNKFTNRCKNNRRILRRKKSNIVCPMFRRQGKCSKLSQKRCSFLHDKKFVTLCQNHIQGICTNEACPLSHDLIPEKMPVCLHFLNGSCHNDECPYSHTKVDVSAPICSRFLRGYCELAAKCTDWHVIACPEYKTTMTCTKGEKCKLPHRDAVYFEGKADNEEPDENSLSWRYFEKNKLDEKDDAGVQIIPQRQSLGVLPDYIPLR